jgi:fructokinase
MTEIFFAGVEGGGTTFKVAIAKGTPTNIIESAIFETNKDTISHVIQWLKSNNRHFDALGIGCFGPLDLDPSSKTYGYITTTPKPGFQYYDVLGPFRRAFPNIPIGFDTDVNAAVLGEQQHGQHGPSASAAYVTVGTGVGVGIVTNGRPVHGLLHPEMGHYYVQLRPGDNFLGNCPIHKTCLEGLVAAPALAKRAKLSQTSDLTQLMDDDPIWDIAAWYLAQLCTTLILTVSPHRIVLGGGVMKRSVLFSHIRRHTLALLNGYIAHPTILHQIDSYIVPSRFNENAGIVGALELGNQTLLETTKK